MASLLMAAASQVVLPGYECQIGADAVEHSKSKLAESAAELLAVNLSCTPPLFQSESVSVEQLPCSFEESLSYRCTVGFQMLREGPLLSYAMRNDFRPVPIGCDFFPIANARIQSCMRSTLSFLNASHSSSPSSPLTCSLQACKFVSSWDAASCLLTLSYDTPVSALDAALLDGLGALRDAANLTSVSARSKGVEVVVGERKTIVDEITVPGFATKSGESFTVKYEKPDDAFQHPNSCTMKKALAWILDKIHTIWAEREGAKIKLLEMYCGMGAHTMCLGRCGSDVFDRILAIELDQRLVDACQNNIILNGLQEKVAVIKADAGEVAKRIIRRRALRATAASSLSSGVDLNFDDMYDVLLVDPPRAGLDKHVCALAKVGGFEHMLYISCGRHALKRDLALLGTDFAVRAICVTDLFPRTDAVESLVWLTRRPKTTVP